ncbi:SDR family oxidoreductase [Primorskyibacter sp. 2E233]|uniref:SDR family oxidoreductase n=1 Tax=Primorskyibacter sp. 2E233 TaxID=3413431 RepID=UPI003BF2891D
MSGTLLTLGHGYSARALARRLKPQGWTILGTTRSKDKAVDLRAEGVTPVLWNKDDVLAALEKATHLLISAAPDDQGDPALRLLGDKIDLYAPDLHWAGYLSTTGVYGDHHGAWVDEATPLTPSTERGEARVQAEADWGAIPHLPLHVFRLAGIYGPGRGPFSKVRNGTARRIVKQGQVFSRIHVDDIAQVLEASIKAPNPGAVYNLCDDDPAPPQDVIAYAAELLGLPVPPEIPFEQVDLSPMARSFYSESKRVSNSRIKHELGIKLMYPDYRAGLAALLRDESA